MKLQRIVLAVSLGIAGGNAYAAKGGIGALFGALIGGVTGHAIGKAALQPVSIDETIAKMASEVNKQLPMNVDRDTRLDSVAPGVGRQFTYHYTFVNNRSQDFDRVAWYQAVSPLLKNKVCTNPDMQIFFKYGISISYSYQGREGGHVGKVTISPSDCGF